MLVKHLANTFLFVCLQCIFESLWNSLLHDLNKSNLKHNKNFHVAFCVLSAGSLYNCTFGSTDTNFLCRHGGKGSAEKHAASAQEKRVPGKLLK